MPFRLGDLGKNTSYKRQGVDGLSFYSSVFRVIVRGFDGVEDVLAAGDLLHGRQAHRTSEHVASHVLERPSISSGNTNGIRSRAKRLSAVPQSR